MNKIKTEYTERSPQIDSCWNPQEFKTGKEEKITVNQSINLTPVYACPFKREDHGMRCKNKSMTLTEMLNHFYHHHMERVNLDGRQPRFPLCCFVAACTEQFIFHQDLVRHMARHGQGGNIHFVQCLLNQASAKQDINLEVDKERKEMMIKLTDDFGKKFVQMENDFLEKEKELVSKKEYFEKKYEKEVMQCSNIIQNSELVAENQSKYISDLENNNQHLQLGKKIHEQIRIELENRIGELEGTFISVKKECKEKGTKLYKEIDKNNIENVAQKHTNIKETVILTIKQEYKSNEETKSIEESAPRKVIPKVENATLTSDIVNLNEIINLLKGENGHLLMKSKLQKQTRDMLEVKICTLENKLIYLQENVSKSKKRLKLNEEKEKLKQEKEMLLHNKYKQQ